jgi:Ca2+-binding RTX toxin-like protein
MPTIFGTLGSDTIVPGFSSPGVTGGVIAPIGIEEDDIIDGGAGADIMDAGDGSDIYFVDNVDDFVAEQFNDFLGGVDEIRSSVSYSIGDNPFFNGFGIENITLLGFDNINATGNSNNNVLVGNSVANILNGLGGDDTFLGGSGNDSYDGGDGFDTIDYSGLGQRVTLKSQGVIEKAGGFGIDTIAGVERIIGTLGKSNVIDGTVAGPQTTSFNINLAFNDLTVNGIPGIGSASFFVQNFTDVRGTSNSDTVVGDGARNVFFGTAGSDSYDGLGGFDTIDYGALGTAITLKSQGIIEKGALGTDTIAGMERIIGAAGQINVIDGFTGGPQPTSFEIDLDGGLLLVKNIPGIGDQAFFIKNFVDVRGTTNDDIIIGSSVPGIQGDNTFFGSSGNDSYDGAGGIDTIDYGALGTAITLKSQGIIEKGALGTDTIAGVERIIGTLGLFNVIDGTVAGPQTTSFDINLAANNLTVNGIPGIGSASFFIQNFIDVRGTSNSDTVVGDDSSSWFFGSAGNDSYDGAFGFDRIDYSGLGQSITLKSQGVIVKSGGLGTDTIANIDQIIGDVGQSNVIDGTVAGPQATSFDINLATNNLTVNGIPGIGSASFFVQNFTDVRGTTNSDTVVGDAAANSFFGSAGNDTLNGGAGNDTANYLDLGGPVTLGAFGVLSKGALGTDSLVGIETIIGSAGAGDTVNHSGAVSGGGFTVTGTTTNLTTGLVRVNGSPSPLPLTFTVQGFENVIGSNFADSITGSAANNSLNGGSGDDTLDGGGGNDTLIGGAGNDSLIGGAGNDSLTGGGGNDTLIGGGGNDNYNYDADIALNTDTLNEAGGGVDTLNFSATTTLSLAVNLGLAASQVVNANLSLTLGSATTFENVIGGGLADTLTGNTLANSLTGGGGNDTLDGRAGNDTLIGGAGADRFRFATALNATTNRDVISDFSIAQGDTIQLENAVFTALTTTGTLAASAFFIGAAATTAAQRILYNSAAGSLLYDEDGSGAIGSIAFATLTSGLALTNTSFTIT